MSLQVAIVGCGAVAQRLYRKPLQLLEKRGALRVATLVDPVREHAEGLSAFFPRARHHVDLGSALAAVNTDLVLILSPAHLHCTQAVEAMQSGSHVLCEKPMAATAAECARMNEVAVQTGKVLAIGMIRRFFPAFAELRNRVADGDLGHVESFEYREGHKFEWDVTTPAAFRRRSEGGTGVLFDIGPHALDALTWILGNLEVRAYEDDALGGIESNLSMSLASRHFAGTMDLSWDQPQANELRVRGSRAEAVLRIDRFDQLALGRPGQFVAQPVTVSFPSDVSPSGARRFTPKGYPDAIFGQLVQTLRSIQLGEPPAVDGASGQACIAVMEAGLRMAQPLFSPWLEPAEQRALRELHWRTRA